MAIPRPSEKLRTAIAAAAESLSRSLGRIAADRPVPSPGDLYVFDVGRDDVGVEWLVVRVHPDDSEMYLVVPVDDFPLAGTPDLVLPEDRVGRPMIVRGGEADWFPRSLFTPKFRVGALPDDVLLLVRKLMADLARGRVAAPADPTVDGDPEYEDWLADVAQARENLLARAELLSVVPCPEPAATTAAVAAAEFVLAAEPGGGFFAALPQPVVAELAAVADEPLWRTNAAWCIERLRERQPELADCLWRALPRQNPGVVGLVIDIVNRESFVVPLAAERSAEWHVDPTLPFRPAATLQELLVKLLHALALPHLHGVPERFAFTLRDPLGRRSDGPSMHIAGLLAVIRRANDNPALFDRACCVLQPDGDRLVPVGSIPHKLEAFRREYGTGSLLVRSRDTTAAFDEQFETVWEVDSLGELARLLEQADLLQVFLEDQPLSRVEANTIANRVHQLEALEHRYAEALDLSLRAERAGFRPEVPNHVRRLFRQNIIDLYRHLGAYSKTAERAREEHARARTSSVQSYEEQAQADLTYAAALYDLHRFGDMHELLDPWRARLATDPLLLLPFTRVKVCNTLGRAWVALGRDGWEELFQRSEKILQELEPTDLPRTWSYLAHGYLRAGRGREAEEVLARIETHPGLDDLSRWFLRFYQADWARRQGRTWSDPEMERATLSPRVGHPFAFYFQATARQPDRPVDDAIDRFQRACAFLTQDQPDGDPQNIQRFLADCLRLAEAAWRADQTRWTQAVMALEGHLSAPGGEGLARHYAGAVPPRDSAPSRAAAEQLLNRVPYF
uniref:Uncharacterized protein n=1 Tax=Schlesneria paludicola TaxID=360056 RepID=A0A7C4QQ30_9PLAN